MIQNASHAHQSSALLDECLDAFAHALRPPEKLKPSEWAEKYRILRQGYSAMPGPWRNRNAPYLAGIMDAAVESGVQEIVVMKGARVGYSECLRNLIGFWSDTDPDPAMFVMPDQPAAEKMVGEQIAGIFEDTPQVRRLRSRNREDNTKTLIRLLNQMEISAAWAGSAQSLASTNQRRVIFDETDKYPPFVGREAGPIQLGDARCQTFRDRALKIRGSTPTTSTGIINQLALECTDHRHYHVPCLNCGFADVLWWPRIKWSPKRDNESYIQWAERIEGDGDVWFECYHCQQKTREENKARMVRQGQWISQEPDASNRRVAFYLPATNSLMFDSWRIGAAEFIRAKESKDPSKLMHFVNSYLGEAFEQEVDKPRPAIFQSKTDDVDWNPGVVPDWAGRIIATADTQKDHFWLRIRAWGSGYRSRALAWGRVESFDELEQRAIHAVFKTESGFPTSPSVLLIDSGGTRMEADEVSRTVEVYQFVLRNPAQIWPIKGASARMETHCRLSNVTPKVPPGFPALPPVALRLIDTDWYKDLLMARINDEDQSLWELSGDETPEYFKQMVQQRKVFDRKKNRTFWQPISEGADDHAFDTETYQMAAADLLGVASMPDEMQLKQMREQHQVIEQRERETPRPRPNDSGSRGFTANSYKGRY